MLWSSWSTLTHSLVIGAGGYVALIVWLRLSGKRTLSQWNAFDAIVTFALGSMLATATLSPSINLVQGAAAFGLFVLLQYAITWLAVRSAPVRRLIKARPTLLVHRGRMLADVMRRERVTEGEVLAAVREKGLAGMSQVYAVVLETSGRFSVIAGPAGDDHSALDDVAGARQ
ncbi:MAG: YetF domain-containing protein [Casimicrobiaceae bacterium]